MPRQRLGRRFAELALLVAIVGCFGEDIITEWRVPGGEFARKILK